MENIELRNCITYSVAIKYLSEQAIDKRYSIQDLVINDFFIFQYINNLL